MDEVTPISFPVTNFELATAITVNSVPQCLGQLGGLCVEVLDETGCRESVC